MYSFSLKPAVVPQVESRHRRIRTAIPNPETLDTIHMSLQCEPASMNDQLPVVWDRAKGYQVFDKSGNCWIDFTSTIFVANVGHTHPRVQEAIEKTARQGLLNAYYYPTELRARLAKKMIALAPKALNRVLFLSTGSEASEVAVKITLMHGRKQSPEKSVIVAFEGSFHGKTMGAQMLGGKPYGKKWIGFHHPGLVHLPYPYPWVLAEKGQTGAQFFQSSLRELEGSGINLNEIAGFMAEPYQGWAAVFFPKDYMQALRKWATEHGALVGFDEVQAGFGRTGKLFGYEHYSIEPDIIWCAKALSSSIPVSAVLANERILDVDPSLNSTHGGNPIGMAASLATLEVLEQENLVAESARKGRIVLDALRQWQKECPQYIHEIYGEGLVWGILVRDPKTKALDVDLVDRVIERAMQKGVLSIRTGCGTLKLGPPLVTPDEALLEGIDVLKESLREILDEGKGDSHAAH